MTGLTVCISLRTCCLFALACSELNTSGQCCAAACGLASLFVCFAGNLSKLLRCSRLLSCTLPHQSQRPTRLSAWHGCLRCTSTVGCLPASNCKQVKETVFTTSDEKVVGTRRAYESACRVANFGATHQMRFGPLRPIFWSRQIDESGPEFSGAFVTLREENGFCQASFDITDLWQ